MKDVWRAWVVGLAVLAACSAPSASTLLPGVTPPSVANASEPAPRAGLDDLTQRLWDESGVTIAPRADDHEFVRRAYLDLLGRIPTPVEIDIYDRHPPQARRERLIDRLLASPEHASYWADLYVDVLLPDKYRNRELFASGLHRWLTASFEQGRPYDEVMFDLVTARGNVAGETPAAYLWSQYQVGGVDSLAQSAVKLLVDENLACAQCHDDPTNAANTNARYERVTAYFSRVHHRRRKDVEPQQRYVLVELDAPVKLKRFGKVERGFDGRDCANAELSDRACLMSLVQDDPRFAQAAVQRAWQHMFGQSLEHPQIVATLREQFVDSGYDLRGLLRALALSDAYGRSSQGGAPNPSGVAPEDVFARARVRPLDARRLGTSMLVAMSIVPTTPLFHPNPPALQRVVAADFRGVFPDYTLEPTPETNLQRELLLLNGRLANSKAMLRDGGRLPAILAKHDKAERRVQAMFLAAYARAPSPSELDAAVGLLDTPSQDVRGYADLFAALLTSTEFITNH